MKKLDGSILVKGTTLSNGAIGGLTGDIIINTILKTRCPRNITPIPKQQLQVHNHKFTILVNTILRHIQYLLLVTVAVVVEVVMVENI